MAEMFLALLPLSIYMLYISIIYIYLDIVAHIRSVSAQTADILDFYYFHLFLNLS